MFKNITTLLYLYFQIKRALTLKRSKKKYFTGGLGSENFISNRPFYRYGGHIELIQFKEYYRMPRGHENISFVFSSAFRDIFS